MHKTELKIPNVNCMISTIITAYRIADTFRILHTRNPLMASSKIYKINFVIFPALTDSMIVMPNKANKK